MNANIVGLIIGLILAVVTIFLILSGNKPAKTVQEPTPLPTAEKLVDTSSQDDLVLIEGIGPKIAVLLNQQGIKTFAQLAATPVPVLQKILEDNALRFIKPDSWPEQARLAAAGQMEELKALQDKLVAGR